MNWVGGARSRVRISEEKRKQKEFFQKRKLANTCNKLKPQVSSTVPYLSQDLLFFQTLDKCAKKSKPNTPPTVTKVDFGLYSKHRKTKSFDVEMPMSPDSPANVIGDKTSKRFTGCVSSELAQKHENIHSVKVCDEENISGKHSAHHKEAAMKNWEEKWLKVNSASVHHDKKLHGHNENYLRNSKENHPETIFPPTVSTNKILESLSTLPNENRMYKARSQKPKEERNHGILRGSTSNSVGRKEQASPLQKSDVSKFSSQNCDFNICELLLNPDPSLCSKEMPWMPDTVQQSVDKYSITNVHKSKNFESNYQWCTSSGGKGEFHNLQNSHYAEGFKEDGNTPFMKLWDRSNLRNDCREVKAVRERRTHASELAGKLNISPQHSSAIKSSKITASIQKSLERDNEKQIVVINLEEDENVLDKDPLSLTSMNSDDITSLISKSSADFPENLLKENSQLKHMIPLVIKEFVSEFCERYHLFKNDDSKETAEGSVKSNLEIVPQNSSPRNSRSTNSDMSSGKADDTELLHWKAQELDVCNTENQNFIEDEDPMGSFVEYSHMIPKKFQNSTISPVGKNTVINARKTEKVSRDPKNRNQRNEDADVMEKYNFELFSDKNVEQKTESVVKKKNSEDCGELKLKSFTCEASGKHGQAIYHEECIKIDTSTAPRTKKQQVLCCIPATADTATQTVIVPVMHSACQAMQITVDSATQTHINRNTKAYIEKGIQTYFNKSTQTCADQNIQACANMGVQTHSDMLIQTFTGVCDGPKSFAKRECDLL